MIEVWKKYLDKGDLTGVILMDHSKVFDTMNTAKLEAFGLSFISLKLERMQAVSKNTYKWFLQ